MPRLSSYLGIMFFLAVIGSGCQPAGENGPPLAEPPATSGDMDNPGSLEKKPPTDKVSLLTEEPSEADSKLRIRLKRDAKGNYSWEITGSNIKQITESDQRLRKRFGAPAPGDQKARPEE